MTYLVSIIAIFVSILLAIGVEHLSRSFQTKPPELES